MQFSSVCASRPPKPAIPIRLLCLISYASVLSHPSHHTPGGPTLAGCRRTAPAPPPPARVSALFGFGKKSDEEKAWKEEEKEEQFRKQQEVLARRRNNSWQQVGRRVQAGGAGGEGEGEGWAAAGLFLSQCANPVG